MLKLHINESENIVKKRKRVSKKNKKSWRKHVDIEDVDNFLEDKRLEERLGVPFSKRKDAELFTIDTQPSKDEETLKNDDNNNTKAAYRMALKNSEPRCFAILKPDSAVQDPIAKRNRVRTPEERKNPITKKKEALRKAKGQLKMKEKIAIANRKLAEEKKKNEPKRGEYNLDVWNVKPKVIEEIGNKIDLQWLTSDTLRHTLANKGVGKRKIPKTVHQKPSILPAVEPPHPGMSYNPAYEDHQELLSKVAEEEIKLMKKEAHLNRVTTKMFKKQSPAEITKRIVEEASEGLPSTDKNNSSDNENEDNENLDVLSVNPPVKRNKKTRVQRRKLKEQHLLAAARKQEKLEKRKISDIYKLKKMKEKLEGLERKHEILRERKEKAKAIKAAEPKILSKTKFEAPDLDFQMGEELSGNLRGTQTRSNLLNDRYKSLQQRNIVAPSTRVLKLNKPKVKRYIKPDHKIKMPRNKKTSK